MYFLTDKDPNYSVKGSRDPLGIQVIWQSVGRKLIPDLSTVSISIIDFQIICIAYYFKQEFKIDDQSFQLFFSRLEKLMAFTRLQKNDKLGFNGIDRVRKLSSNGNKGIVIDDKQEILSNQKAYGIWGKYNRPFTDIKITEEPGFYDIFEAKIGKNSDAYKMIARLFKKPIGQTSYFSKTDLEHLYPLIEKPEGAEKELFITTLLKDTCENALYKEITNKPIFAEMYLYQFVDELSASTKNEQLKTFLGQIKRTELVLSPLNRLFRHLQTKSRWTDQEIENNIIFSETRTTTHTEDLATNIQELNLLLSQSNIGLVRGLVNKNEQVTANRKSAPWLKINQDGIDVNHYEGARPLTDYDPAEHHDNSYFIATYQSIYKQLH